MILGICPTKCRKNWRSAAISMSICNICHTGTSSNVWIFTLFSKNYKMLCKWSNIYFFHASILYGSKQSQNKTVKPIRRKCSAYLFAHILQQRHNSANFVINTAQRFNLAFQLGFHNITIF